MKGTDLIMNYKDFIESALSEAYENALFSDDETLFNIVKERASNMEKKKSRSKKPAVIAASIAAAATLTVSAGAALNWDINALFGDMFGKKSAEQNIMPYIDTDSPQNAQFVAVENTYQNSGFDYSRYGKELDMSYDCEGYTLNLKGVMGEGRVIYLIYDIVFDDVNDTLPKEKFTEWEPICILDTTDDLGLLLDDILIQKVGNTYTYCSHMTASNDLYGKTLTVDFKGLRRIVPAASVKLDYDYTDIDQYGADFKAEIPIDFESNAPSRNIELNEPITVYDLLNGKLELVETVLYNMTITPFTCTYSFCMNGKDFGKAECYFTDPITFTFGNGTELIQMDNMMRTDAKTDTQTGFLEFDQPVEPDDIVSVTIDGKTIPLK